MIHKYWHKYIIKYVEIVISERLTLWVLDKYSHSYTFYKPTKGGKCIILITTILVRIGSKTQLYIKILR